MRGILRWLAGAISGLALRFGVFGSSQPMRSAAARSVAAPAPAL